MRIDINELNKKICNPIENINSLGGFEIIIEALVYKIYDLFGKNSLLSMLYQIGKGPGEIISKRIKEKYNKEKFQIEEALEILMNELKEYYSIQIKDIEYSEGMVKIIIENHCFLRDTIKHRGKLHLGKGLCRVNKGYFETAFNELTNIKKVEINFLENDEEKDICIEELNFYF